MSVDSPTTDYNNWQTACNQTAEYTQKAQEEMQHLQYMLAVMVTVSTQVAFDMIPGVELIGSNVQGTAQVAAEASTLNEQNAALSLVSLTQSLFNDLVAGAPGYNAYVYDQQNPTQPLTNPDTGQPVPADTPQQAQDYVNEYNEFNECLTDLTTMFSTPGWCDSGTEETMTQSITNIQQAMTNLTTYNASTGDYKDTQAPSSTNNSQCDYFAQHCMQYQEDPSSSYWAADFNSITMSLNTMQATMNQVSSATTGELKSNASQYQQLLSNTDSNGKQLIELQKYLTQHQVSN